ncbi:MAG: molybdopterin-dependent oxidoreductase, partial [Gammaproteobacteria bacterium]|nr:molybdopterin-dependent oxidoreductase [Gammaproteobacteria bacterium]
MEDRQTQQIRETAAGKAVAHESAALHVAGEATYVDDIPELAGTCHIALGLSSEAHATIKSIDLDAVRIAPGVVAVLTAADIPATNDCGPIIHDDPILADGLVQFVGQPIFAAVATSFEAARKAVRLAEIEYEALPAVLDVATGKAQQSWVLPPMQLRRGDAEQALKSATHRLQGEISIGGQEQFYLEGQISYVAPKEDGCFHLWCSTQHPSEMQQVVAHALGID